MELRLSCTKPSTYSLVHHWHWDNRIIAPVLVKWPRRTSVKSTPHNTVFPYLVLVKLTVPNPKIQSTNGVQESYLVCMVSVRAFVYVHEMHKTRGNLDIYYSPVNMQCWSQLVQLWPVVTACSVFFIRVVSAIYAPFDYFLNWLHGIF